MPDLTYPVGIVTAYGAAKEAGYTGTYAQFCADQASFAANARQVAVDKAYVVDAKQTVITAMADIDEKSSATTANALEAERWAVGTENGDPVPSSDITHYHRDAEYLAGQAVAAAQTASSAASSLVAEALKSEGWARGTQNGDPVTSESPYYHNNSKYFSDYAASEMNVKADKEDTELISTLSRGRQEDSPVGQNSFAFGEGVVANSKDQHVFGEYNVPDSNETTTAKGEFVEIIGNGTGDEARSNARTLDWNGNEQLAGDLAVNVGTEKETSINNIVDELNGKQDVLYRAIESGSKATFRDGAGGLPLKELRATFDNVDGLSQIEINITGKNQLPINAESGSENGITYTVNGDGSITLNGTSTAQTSIKLYSGSLNIPKTGSVMWLKGCGDDPAQRFTLRSNVTTMVGHSIMFSEASVSVAAYDIAVHYNHDARYKPSSWSFYLVVLSGRTFDNETIYPSLTTESGEYKYEPYVGNSYTIQFPQDAGTVHNGELTVNRDGTGVLTVNDSDPSVDYPIEMPLVKVFSDGNNVWASIGNIALIYPVDAALYLLSEVNDVADIIADEYIRKIYLVGAYAIHQNGLYRCKTNIMTPEDWNSSHWDEVKLTSRIAERTDTVLETTLSRGRQMNSPVGANSFAFGSGLVANSRSQHVFGEYNVADTNTNANNKGEYIEIVGNGANSGARSNARTLDWNGNEELSGGLKIEESFSRGRKENTSSGTGSIAFGNEATATGDYSQAEGNLVQATNTGAHAEGYGYRQQVLTRMVEYPVIASGIGSHAEGKATNATAQAAHSEGTGTYASALASHAEGEGCHASGEGSHAEGISSAASGDGSHAEGDTTVAARTACHAEGSGSLADGNYSHAEGDGTMALGEACHAEGSESYAYGDFAHAEGKETIAAHKSQHVFGEYNVEDPSNAASTARGTYVEIVGNGTGNNARANARTLDWDGNERIAGILTMGAAPTEDMDAATKKYVDDETARAIAEEERIEALFNAPALEAIDTWFGNHPEATTLVADHSLSHEKFEEGVLGHITPQHYGAKGNGTYDDTDALSEAFNRSNAVIEGANLRYKITEITMTECQNLVIRNFRFYHGISIKLKHCENIIFQNCVWDEFQDNGIEDKKVHCVILATMHNSGWEESNNWYIDEVCKNITFDQCQFIGTHYSESTPSMFSGSKPHYNTGMCLRLEGVDGLRVVGCYFTQNRGNACIQQNCYAPLGDYEITNNFFYLNCWGGIELYRYTGTSSHPTRVIQGNRFIGHGLGYLPWSYLELFDENERGVGTAVLLGGHPGRIQNEPAYCAVYNNYFEDNNESSVEGWQWNPVKDNIIIGNGVLQSAESVQEMTAKYKITYQLYVRKNPSQNPIYVGQYTDVQRYPAGEVRSIENNTIGRFFGTRNPIIIRGYFYEPVIVRNNTITDGPLFTDENCKYAHFLSCSFFKGIIWENNIGLKPYFNACTFAGGEYRLDDLQDVYSCTFTSQAFESVSKTDRFQNIRCARFSPEYATLRDNEVTTLVNGKPVLGYRKHSSSSDAPVPAWNIKNQTGYTSEGYAFGGETNPTILNTGCALGATDTGWTIFADATTLGDNSAGNNTYLIKLLTFSDDSGNLSLEFGSRYTDQAWTWIFPNGVWNYDTAYQIDGSSAKNFLRPDRTSRFVLRHKAGVDKIEVFALRNGMTVSSFGDLKCGEYPFTSGTAGTLRFGGVPNSNRPKSYYNGRINDASVYQIALSDSQVSMLMLDTDITPQEEPEMIYDISDDSRFVTGTGLVMDGTFAIDTEIPLLENTDDFTIIARFKFDKMRGENGQPNFSFFPVFSAMSAAMPSDAHAGNSDKGFDVGLSMQDGKDMSKLAVGGFIGFRRDWRYNHYISIDGYNYSNYQNIYYTVIVRRKNGVITVYDTNLMELGKLTGDYATTIVNGNLTIGATMGYGSGYTNFFKGVIIDFRVYDSAIDLSVIEQEFASIYDNDVSEKGAVTYHLSNKSNYQRSVRYALVEINYDLGEFNSAEYTAQYPKAFGIRLDKIYDDIVWIPCSSSKRVVFTKLCKWDAVYKPFQDWNIDIVNPGTVPGLNVTVTGVKVLLLSKQEKLPETIDATDFTISWESDLADLGVGDTILGYVQYLPEEATSGLTLTASSDDTEVATVSVSGQDVTITGVAAGETLIHVSIPYGTERVYSVTVTD